MMLGPSLDPFFDWVNSFMGIFFPVFGVINIIAIVAWSSHELASYLVHLADVSRNKADGFTEDELGEGYFSLLEADCLGTKKSYQDEMNHYDNQESAQLDLSSGITMEDLLQPDGEIPDKFLGGSK